MHVLYLHQFFVTNASSAATRSYDFARLLVARGHRVTVVTGLHEAGDMAMAGERLFRRMELEGIDVYVLNVPFRQGWGGLKRALSFLTYAGLASSLALRIDRPDVIYATSAPPTVAVPAMLARLFSGVPFVFELRDVWPESLIAVGLNEKSLAVKLLRGLNRATFKRARRLTTITPAFRGLLEKRYGVSPEGLVIIPLGADGSLFPEPSGAVQDGEETLRKAPIGAEDMVVIYAGAFGRVNNLDYMLDVAALLRDRDDIKFILMGRGADRERLEARKGLEQLDHVIFHDVMAKADLVRVLHTADVGVNCVKDGEQNRVAFPNKVFDYFFAGLAVLTTAPAAGGGYLQDLVQETRCGAGVDATRPQVAAELLGAWADDREGLEAMGQRSRELAEREYDRAILVDRLESVLEEAARDN